MCCAGTVTAQRVQVEEAGPASTKFPPEAPPSAEGACRPSPRSAWRGSSAARCASPWGPLAPPRPAARATVQEGAYLPAVTQPEPPSRQSARPGPASPGATTHFAVERNLQASGPRARNGGSGAVSGRKQREEVGLLFVPGCPQMRNFSPPRWRGRLHGVCRVRAPRCSAASTPWSVRQRWSLVYSRRGREAGARRYPVRAGCLLTESE